jgi:hypothetical protein
MKGQQAQKQHTKVIERKKSALRDLIEKGIF